MTGPSALCSCGVEGCREFGWPHEWDPLASGDSCTVTPPPAMTATVGDRVWYWPPESTPHAVRAPFVRWGSGYACVACVAIHAPEELR